MIHLAPKMTLSKDIATLDLSPLPPSKRRTKHQFYHLHVINKINFTMLLVFCTSLVLFFKTDQKRK